MWRICAFCRFCPDGGDLSHKDFWVQFGTMERTQAFTNTGTSSVVPGVGHFLPFPARILHTIETNPDLYPGMRGGGEGGGELTLTGA